MFNWPNVRDGEFVALFFRVAPSLADLVIHSSEKSSNRYEIPDPLPSFFNVYLQKLWSRYQIASL